MATVEENTVNGVAAYSKSALHKFLIASSLGVLLFLVPFDVDGGTKVLLGIMAEGINTGAGDYMRIFCVTVFVLSAILTPLFSYGPAVIRRRLPALAGTFDAGPFANLLRITGGVIAAMTFLGVGPLWIVGDETGNTAYFAIASIIFCLVGVGATLMPLLTDYGLLELVGTLLRRFFQAVFRLPGRATIDALASWVGSSSIAVLVTARQYEGGFYTAREASVIATNFSVVSVPFVFFCASVAGVPQYGGSLYVAMVIIGITCALITPRLPPLSGMPDTYYEPVGQQRHEEVEPGISTWQWARHEAMARAEKAPAPLPMLRSGLMTTVDLFFAMMPAAMTIEFSALVLYYHTELLHFVTAPLVPLLEFMAIPDAEAAAPGLVIGLLDQFVPSIIAGGIASPVTSFVLAGLSVTQLIFMAETGVLIHRSKIPLPVSRLVQIFVIRTIIALPMLTVIAHWLARET